MATPSFDDLKNLGVAEVLLRRPSLGLRSGDISDMFLSASAAMGDRAIGWAADRIAATFLDGASGDDLTLLAVDHWGIQRFVATSSVATVTFTRAGADATAQTIPVGAVVATLRDSAGEDIQYLTTSAASWPASTNGTRTVNVSAVVPGLKGNLSAANLIVRIVSTPPAGGTYTITASTLPAGGADAESDSDLRDRVRLYPSTLRRGTPAALEYGAKSTVGVSVAKATAVIDGTGLVTVYVSDASGNSTGTPKTVAVSTTDDGTMTAKVAVELYNWAAASSFVQVVGGAIQTLNITVQLTVKLGVNVTQLVTDVQDAISARVGRLTIGQTLYLTDITTAVKAVDPDNIVNVTMITPTIDTAPSLAGNLLRAGVITVQ